MTGIGIEMELIAAALVAGLLNLDNVQVGGFMLSRPIVTAPIVGAVMGDPLLGLWVGASMELLWLTVLPVGNFVPPDSQVAAAAGAIAAATWKDLLMGEGHLEWVAVSMAAVFFAVPVGFLARMADVKIRERSEKIARSAEGILEAGRDIYSSLLILQALAETFVKTVLLAAGAGVVALLLRPVIAWGLSSVEVKKGLWTAQFLLPVVGLALLLNVLGIRERWYYFLLGIAIFFAAHLVYGTVLE